MSKPWFGEATHLSETAMDPDSVTMDLISDGMPNLPHVDLDSIYDEAAHAKPVLTYVAMRAVLVGSHLLLIFLPLVRQ